MSGLEVCVQDLSVAYGTQRALDGVTLTIPAGQIHGLLGRNGAGKTTLLSAIASLRHPPTGTISVGGRPPFEDEQGMADICLVRESGDVLGDENLQVNLKFQQMARPRFDREYAEQLLVEFDLPPKRKVHKLSRGQQSAFGVVIGLASRAPVTMFDEVHLGMDAPARQRFYDLLLADYAVDPRTFVVSTHLINEIENLVEAVTVLHHGRVLISDDVDELRRRGVTVTGPVAAVEQATSGLSVIGVRDLGPTRQVTVFDEVSEHWRSQATEQGMTVGTAALHDLFIRVTDDEYSTELAAQASAGGERSSR